MERTHSEGEEEFRRGTSISSGELPAQIVPEERVKLKKHGNDAFSIEIKGHTIVVWKNPIEKDKDISASGGLEGAGGRYKSREKSVYNAVIDHEKLGLMPLQEWEKKIAREVSNVSGAQVNPSNLVLSTSVTLDKLVKCPKCRKALFVVEDNRCWECKEIIFKNP